jgi:glutamate dehydrogenase (NAD(P)+)
MGDAFHLADELGPTKLIQVHLPAIGLKAVLVVDNVAAGPAIGGVRMAADVSVEECFRLARAMTLKNACAGLPHGGAKVVVYSDPKMPAADKERLIRGLACALGDIRDYIFGPDMGTDETCMGWVHDEIGRAVGLPRALGGIPLDEIGATGWGLAHATEVTAAHAGLKLAGARVVIQGYGAVGRHAARFLAQKGALVVGVADSRGSLAAPEGIDLGLLGRLKAEGKSVLDYPGGRKADAEEVIDIECEIWIPAARPDVVNEANVERLKTRLVIEGANIPVTAAAEEALHRRGVLCVPDFIANAGGVICGAVEYRGGSEAAAMELIATKVRRNTDEILAAAASQGVPPRAAALELALARVRRAMSLRRWGLF